MSVTDGDAGARSSILIPFMALSTLFIALRCYINLLKTKSSGLDDLFAAFAWGGLMAQSAVQLYDQHRATDVELVGGVDLFSFLPTINLLYLGVTGLLRLSVLLYLRRLNRQQMFKSFLWALGFAIQLQTLSCLFIYLFACKDVKDLWVPGNNVRRCMDTQHQAFIFWSQSISGVAIDLSLLLMATWALYFHQKATDWNIKVIAVLLLGLFVLTTGVLQLGHLFSTDFSNIMEVDTTSTWSTLQEHIGLWVSCLPTFLPIAALVTAKLGLESKLLASSAPESTGSPEEPAMNRNRHPPPIRIPPKPQIGIAISTDLEHGNYTENGKALKREDSIRVITTTVVDVSSRPGTGTVSWHGSKSSVTSITK